MSLIGRAWMQARPDSASGARRAHRLGAREDASVQRRAPNPPKAMCAMADGLQLAWTRRLLPRARQMVPLGSTVSERKVGL